jgi:L-ascorbate metabolism protein UlaG (beta-lactamase superfamily)
LRLKLHSWWVRIPLLIFVLIVAIGGLFMALTWKAVGTSSSGIRLEQMKASPNYQDGKFVNLVPMVEFSIMESLAEWIKGGSHTTPDGPLPMVRRTGEEFETLPASGLRVTWLGHSTALVELDGQRLLLDPLWSQRTSPVSWTGPKRFFDPPLPLDDLPPLDAVLISHDHFDHLDMETVVKLGRKGVPFIVPLGIGAHLEYWGIDQSQITEVDWWDVVEVGPLTITATPARHFSGRSPVMLDRNRTLWTGFAIVGPDHRVYYTGDTGMFNEFETIGKKLGPFDVMLVEVGAYHRLWADYHLGPEQALIAAELAQAKLVLPVHWGTFDLALHSWTEPIERLLVASQARNIPVAVPRPGESIEPSLPFTTNRWWPDIPWQTAADHTVVSSGVTAR